MRYHSRCSPPPPFAQWPPAGGSLSMVAARSRFADVYADQRSRGNARSIKTLSSAPSASPAVQPFRGPLAHHLLPRGALIWVLCDREKLLGFFGGGSWFTGYLLLTTREIGGVLKHPFSTLSWDGGLQLTQPLCIAYTYTPCVVCSSCPLL